MKQLVNNHLSHQELEDFQTKFKALADTKRLRLLNVLSLKGKTCVCDLTEEMQMSQSKLSYHLKILVDANLLKMETKGTWNYYSVNETEVDALLSEQLCCILKPSK
ncbi:ArsR/SmtB family transcription factor [Shouchella clausii]|uniref:Transcriptional regulator n=1 Tax=Shouchella clausii TaxID=79880 RepID=A0A268RU21_SHOCL|nr:metalloregulator ArsR/SmtB family transcription factor [Shouchella clausii]PAD40825.1 transcriptional regulator [Bacillus sp. 7520-S]SPU21149.1 ArsR family transcriptional regulator [Niallia circulans]AST94854.1 transcriptional regulator [Shouchella clausii]MBU8598854.1 metalloregulator ArsR/SmtB family transcription factor [Shouchella clausii]MCM3551012.1 metalloregulator ArsR/SmtB family transcription factor [Shouchella clausii]